MMSINHMPPIPKPFVFAYVGPDAQMEIVFQYRGFRTVVFRYNVWGERHEDVRRRARAEGCAIVVYHTGRKKKEEMG